MRPIPGPTSLQLLFALPAIQKNPLAYLMDSVATYGNLVKYRAGSTDAFLVNEPAHIRHILQDNHRNYTKNTIQYNQLAAITGRGLLTSDGEAWLRQRRLAQPAFHRRRLERLGDTIVNATANMLGHWETYAQRQEPLDIDEEMMRLALEIVGKALFSIDLRRDAQALTHATLTALDHIVYRSSHFLALPDGVPTPRNRRFKAALRTLDQAVYALIDQRRRSADPPDDLLTLLLTARDEETGAGMTERQVRDEIMTMLIAGHETVASALTWCWFLLSQHPNVVQAAQEEIETVVGERPPTVEDLPRLGRSAQIFAETLRLYPPAWLITRQAQAADELDGQPIPAGSLIIISPYVIHRHPGYWENPEHFDPNRFDSGQADALERFAYIPFGGGPRLCIGDRFATLEAQLIIAQVLQRYQLDLVARHPVDLAPLVTLRPKHGLLVTLRKKN